MKVYQITCRASAIIEETWELRVPDDFDGDPAEAFTAPESNIMFLWERSIDEHDREVIDAELIRKDATTNNPRGTTT